MSRSHLILVPFLASACACSSTTPRLLEIASDVASTAPIEASASGSGWYTPPKESKLDVTQGAGAFVLELTLYTKGHPHLTFYSSAGDPIGGVYFGADEWLLTKKGWSYFSPPRPSAPPEDPQPQKPRRQEPPDAPFELLDFP